MPKIVQQPPRWRCRNHAVGFRLSPVQVEAHFVVAACENMVSNKAMRPGDILTASNNKTIEVLNTDAEGKCTPHSPRQLSKWMSGFVATPTPSGLTLAHALVYNIAMH